jgi:hypothetical protein
VLAAHQREMGKCAEGPGPGTNRLAENAPAEAGGGASPSSSSGREVIP